MEGPLLRQPPGDAQTIDAVGPIEAFRYGAGLIRLNSPDKVPTQRQAGEPVHLGQGFLKIVFPEIRDARRGGEAYGFGSLSLGDSDQSDRGRVSSGGRGRLIYPRPDVVHMKRRILRTN